MIDGFYKNTLSKHIARSRAETAAIKGHLIADRAKLAVAQSAAIARMQADKTRDVKFMKRNNERSSDEPFSIHYAATHGETSRLMVLLERGKVVADIDKRDPDSGWTALHFAARGGHVEFAKLLLKNKANVNATGAEGETPLHLAAGWGTLEVVGLLLQEGADKAMLYKRSDGEKTALDIAHQNLRKDISKFIDRWLPVGLTHSTMMELSAPPDRPHSDEPSKEIASQSRALDMKIRVMGRDSLGLIHTYAKLLNLYRAEGRMEEAIGSSKRVVELRQHDLQHDTGDGVATKKKAVAEAMNNLGELCFAAGADHWDEAKRLFVGSLGLMEELQGSEGEGVMPVLLNYGNFLLETGEFREALGFLERYLRHEEKVHVSEMGTESLALVTGLDLVAYCLVLLKDFDAAEKLVRKANAIVLFHCSWSEKRELDESMCSRYDKLAFLLFARGDKGGAEKEYYKARQVLVSNGRDEFDEDVLRLENNMAVCCCAKRPGPF